MEVLLQPIYKEIASRKETLGILVVKKIEQFDANLIVLEETSELSSFQYDVKHFNIEDKKVALHIIGEKQFLEWISTGTHRRFLFWLLNGKVLFDRNGYIDDLRKTLYQYPINIRKKEIGIEYAKLIKSCYRAKKLYEGKHYLDTYNQMIHVLHHLARLSVTEHGFYPDLTVWNQVKQLDPEIYKLYIELIESNESLEKRVKLILLAIEFAISSRARIGSSYLVEIMKSKKGAWSISELINEKRLKHLAIDLGILLQYLVSKKIIKVINEEVNENKLPNRKYIVG